MRSYYTEILLTIYSIYQPRLFFAYIRACNVPSVNEKRK